jgi:sugar/nucleoside kinase (ribokinase family)
MLIFADYLFLNFVILMNDICCIGHITADKVVTKQSVVYMPGGTAFYFSKAVAHLELQYLLVTAVATKDQHLLEPLLADGIAIETQPTQHTVCFENIYSENQDHRIQRVSKQADPFNPACMNGISATVFHLGPLLAADIPGEMIIELASRAKVSIDVQGLLRKVESEQVIATDWRAKKSLLPYVHSLKANDEEAAVLTGVADIRASAKLLAEWGVKEVIITLGSLGSLIYADGIFTEIPAYTPTAVVDATGCGDTYMAGYLYQRIKGQNILESGKFGAAMATLKIQASGPFCGNEESVWEVVNTYAAVPTVPNHAL